MAAAVAGLGCRPLCRRFTDSSAASTAGSATMRRSVAHGRARNANRRGCGLGRCLDGRPFEDQLIRVADREVESYEPPEESFWLDKRGACDPDALWTCHRKGRLAAGAQPCLLLGLFNELEGSGIVDHIHHSPYSYAS